MDAELVDIDVDISDETFLKIAKMAHENDITFNEQALRLLKDYIGATIVDTPLPSSGKLFLRYNDLNKKYAIVSTMSDGLLEYVVVFFEIGKVAVDAHFVGGRFLDEDKDDFVHVLYESQKYLEKKFLPISYDYGTN